MVKDHDCKETINTAIQRLQKKVNRRIAYLVRLVETFSKLAKTLLEQNELSLVRYCRGNKIITKVSKFCSFANEELFMAIHEKIKEGAEHLQQPYCLASFWTELLGTHEFSWLVDVMFEFDVLDDDNYEALIFAIGTHAMSYTEEIPKALDDVTFCFICQELLIFITRICLCILYNFKMKCRLKYENEKASFLILWKCGDVEQNPGPAISDVTRDFCKKMISLLVILYQEKKFGRKPIQADYKRKPDEWPDDICYKDPSKCTNDTRHTMLNTMQKLCIDNGVEIPSKWTILIEKYQNLQTRQCSKVKRMEHSSDLHSWLCHLRSLETMDQLFDLLPKIDEQERYEVLGHMFHRMQQYIPDLYSQHLQAHKTVQSMGENEFESQTTLPLNSELGTTDGTATDPSHQTDVDQLVTKIQLARNGASKASLSAVTHGIETTANEGCMADNKAFDTVEPNRIATLEVPFYTNACFMASNRAVTILPCVQENNHENVTKRKKRKLDIREIDNEPTITTKRHKTSEGDEVPRLDYADSGEDDFAEPFQSTIDNHIIDFAADTTFTDLITMIEPILQGFDIVPDHKTSVNHDDLTREDSVTNSMLDELAKRLSDDFINEHSLPT